MLVLTSIFWAAWGLIIYTYLMFPLLLAAGARRFGSPSRVPADEGRDERLPGVAMVVAAYNEASVMEAKLANTWTIDYPRDRFECFVGSDGSDDGTNEILRACTDPRLRRFCFPQRRGKISVLNDLVQRTGAEILVMSDASTMFAPDAVRKLVRHFQDPQVGCVTGELSLERDGGASGEGLYLRYERWIKRNEGSLGCVVGCVGAIFAIRRDLYEPLPPTTLVEDLVICLRVLIKGYRACAEPEAHAVDPPCTTNRGEMSRKARIGAGNFQALGLAGELLHPRYGLRAFAFWGHKVLRWLVPFFLIAALAANLLLLGEPAYRLILLLQAGGILVSWLAYRMPPRKQLPRWTRPVSYFYLMNYALLCGFVRFLFHTQRVTWERAAQEPSRL